MLINDNLYARIRKEQNEIRDVVNIAVEKAKNERRDYSFNDEAINWADLRCVDVDFIIGEYDFWYVANIEEASPACPSFHIFIRENADIYTLEQKIKCDIHISTEW